ncbi:hypothetical protein HL667_12675 [Bradyrhizobium sp. 83012]|uniref:50S ribosomal protein L29 n=1 Tax=Bradyrhizobium aeschynomenes TaxID=2734909 RepID=A0ABX2CC98_9BRAD|nr:hypothetical protein [Bradyrhizobium aeschynomenes]NPU09657.1 hypothetical protein [Bradyrhizobium aeschynomenes]NPU65849.1 hypothetical protein [Bradyrhizobium aeschynomenes]NPV20981.1 hypothetical protein [Bradyrhizobium aeschynomenes]
MGKRAVMAMTEAEVRALSLSQLNQQIAWMEYRANSVGSSSLRKSALRQLTWLEEQREKLHGVRAPDHKRF